MVIDAGRGQHHMQLSKPEVPMVTVGSSAPDFTLETDSGTNVTLSKHRGKKVVLFFYPKDDTPGCTVECKEFRDAMPKFGAKAVVYGISADDRASHEAFRDKFSLTFPLLSDVGHKVCDAYGVWAAKQRGEGILRTTVIVGADGRVEKVFENVRPAGHAAEVLAVL